MEHLHPLVIAELFQINSKTRESSYSKLTYSNLMYLFQAIFHFRIGSAAVQNRAITVPTLKVSMLDF